jgi:integrase
VRFPVTIRHRTSKAKIYAPAGKFAYYRIAYTTAGKRRMQTFAAYSDAKTAAERIVRELADGSQAAALNASQSRDALAALERLATLYQSTGRKFSLLGAVSEFADSIAKLRGRALREAVDNYLQTAAVVKPKGVADVVEEFLESRKHRSEAKDGKRAQLSPIYASNIRTWLTDFAATFPGTAVCDLSKEHLNTYIQKHSGVSTKNRNDRRAAVKMFLAWAARQDYLPANHRLFEADGMARETVESAETDFYRPGEFQKFLDNATPELRASIAIGGLAGLRVEEIMRLDWADVWRVEGHIEVTAIKAKTRQRRLVEICPALSAWLKSCRDKSGKVYPSGVNYFQEKFAALRDELKISIRRNGLRHAFCTYHFALHANENLTAAQAGNSPAMIHAHYKGLATKAEAEKWFNITPA